MNNSNTSPAEYLDYLYAHKSELIEWGVLTPEGWQFVVNETILLLLEGGHNV